MDFINRRSNSGYAKRDDDERELNNRDLYMPVVRFVKNNPIYCAVILYALIVSITHLKSAGKVRHSHTFHYLACDTDV